MNVEGLREEIEFGLSNLDKIYSRIHAFRSADVDPQILQSALSYECIGYFNAIEHLIIRFLKSMRKPVPTGPTSHRDTLRLFESTLQEYSISSPRDVLRFIEDMMAFRHVATKIYGFLIDWNKLKVIVDEIDVKHDMVKQAFVDLVAQVSSST